MIEHLQAIEKINSERSEGGIVEQDRESSALLHEDTGMHTISVFIHILTCITQFY